MKASRCETCEFKGYSPEVCRLHLSKGSGAQEDKDMPCRPINWIGKTAAVGACAGVAATFAGLFAAPVVGLKALIGHSVAAKMTAGGAAGAGVNLARKWKRSPTSPQKPAKRGSILPMYLKRRTE